MFDQVGPASRALRDDWPAIGAAAAQGKINPCLGLGSYPSRSGTPATQAARAKDKAATRQGAIFAGQGNTALSLYLGHDDTWDELPARDFSARISRVSRAHGLTHKSRRRLVFKRVGVLLAAIAVPAMAAPSVEPAEPQVIRFVLPETTPYSPAMEQDFAASAAPDAIDPAAPGQFVPLSPASTFANIGPAARPFNALVGYSDRARAEQCLATAIYYEAASESIDGQRAVAQVVLNRVRHPSWPDNVCGVVFQGSERTTGCQFSFTCDGSLRRQPQASAMARARAVARAALGGFVFEDVGLATHYHRTDIYPYWAPSLHAVTTIGLHRFYRGTGIGGRPSAFSAVYAGNEAIPSRQYTSAVAERAMPADYAADLSAPAYRPAPVVAEAEPALPAAEPAAAASIRPQSGTVLEQHARSGQWLVQP